MLGILLHQQKKYKTFKILLVVSIVIMSIGIGIAC
jgi:hypothetical protein